MSDLDELIRGTLPTVEIQHRLESVILDLHRLEFRIAALQNALELDVEDFVPMEGKDEKPELAVWRFLENSRQAMLGTIKSVRLASRVAPDYPARRPGRT